MEGPERKHELGAGDELEHSRGIVADYEKQNSELVTRVGRIRLKIVTPRCVVDRTQLLLREDIRDIASSC